MVFKSVLTSCYQIRKTTKQNNPMATYNRAEITKTAWKLYHEKHITFAGAMRQAWGIAKSETFITELTERAENAGINSVKCLDFIQYGHVNVGFSDKNGVYFWYQVLPALSKSESTFVSFKYAYSPKTGKTSYNLKKGYEKAVEIEKLTNFKFFL